MNSPIENRIGCVFIPVSDMQRAIAWYTRLFGLSVNTPSHEGHIYDLPMTGDASLILDGHKPVVNSSQPLCFFWTSDIQRTRVFLGEQGVELVQDGENIGSVSTLTFKDLDDNLLMVCQQNR